MASVDIIGPDVHAANNVTIVQDPPVKTCKFCPYCLAMPRDFDLFGEHDTTCGTFVNFAVVLAAKNDQCQDSQFKVSDDDDTTTAGDDVMLAEDGVDDAATATPTKDLAL